MTVPEYIIMFLLNDNEAYSSNVYYGDPEKSPERAKVIIVPSNFFLKDVYGLPKSLPNTPFCFLPNEEGISSQEKIPFLYGVDKIEKDKNGRIILYADIVASAYFLLSRYEEIIKPKCRDKHGRFLSKYSIIFQQEYGMRPLVDEWGLYLRDLLRKTGVNLHEEKVGLSKVFLTHDIDAPFIFYRKEQVLKQMIKNFIHRGTKIKHAYKIYKTGLNDPYYTFPKIIEYDKQCVVNMSKKSLVKSIYFMIAAGNKRTKSYCDIELPKYKAMIGDLKKSGAEIGLHVSYEAGGEPKQIKSEMERMKKIYSCTISKSRNHFLRWREPCHIDEMENAGITEDFSLGYADSIGFRVGTCRPYKFINPKTFRLTNVIIHPMEIMECSLDRKEYMGLNYESAKQISKKIIYEVYKHNGELNLLWHNTSFLQEYHDNLYRELLEHISTLN